eukprot:jgi/Mesvir1/13071/Mv06057-RA.1
MADENSTKAATGSKDEFRDMITSREQYLKLLATTGLKVVEVYSGWCGPCTSMLSTFKRMKNEFDERPLLFFCVQSDGIEELEQYQLQSRPHFLLYRNGVLLETIVGPNVPELVSTISMHMPMSGNDDDLQENPIYIKLQDEAKGKKAQDDKAKKPEEKGKKPDEKHKK